MDAALATYVRTLVETSAGYVAVELITGVPRRTTGPFVVLHVGVSQSAGSG